MRTLGTIALSLAILCGSSAAALAQGERTIYVNGQRLGSQDIVLLDAIAGAVVPDGSYWIDMQTGLWGIQGYPMPLGRIGGDRAAVGPDGAPGYNIRAAGGDMMSDGRCAFVLGVPAGSCD